MSNTLLQVTGLRKAYGAGTGAIEVLKGLDLTIGQAETVALVGASGAGKSTLLHILGTLDRPTGGQVLYDGKDVFGQSERALAAFRNRTIGFVFQFHHLLPEFTALENVQIPALIVGVHRDEAAARAEELLAEVGLSHRTSHKPGEMSGGEQQRVAVARSLVLLPRFVMADEPTGNLDMKTSAGIHELFAELQQARGLALLVVTHNEPLAARMERVVRLVDGKIE